MTMFKAFRGLALLFAMACFPALLSAQCLSGNCQTGSGTFRFTSGAQYTGDFYSGRPHGIGTLQFTNGNRYSGEWETGMRQGRGKMTFANGNTYEGLFVRNQIEGQGTMFYENKDKYEGSWSNSSPNGSGTYFFKSGERYVGAMADGKFDGQGVMYYRDGANFSGQWKDNRKHGQGVLSDPNGKKSEGMWRDGELVQTEQQATTSTTSTGYASTSTPAATTTNARPDVGNKRNCGSVHCRSGDGYVDYPDGSRYVGTFKNGYPEGKGICYYANGDRYEGQWSSNAPNGEGVMYFGSGRVYGAVWENGTPKKELEAPEGLPDVGAVSMEVSKNVKIWAVIVGVANYAHMPTLKFTDDDAYHFFAFLKSPEGGALPDNQIEVLIDDQATRKNILTAMRTTFAKADANDEVILYFSGHGLQGCFLPSDFDGFNNKLRHDEVLKVFGESRAKYKLCIADACHSGSLQGVAAKSPVSATITTFYDAFANSAGGTALLMSSKGEEVSLEDHGLRQGIFSYYLLKGLKGEADTNKDRIISIKEIFNFVYSGVRDYTANAQTPILTGDFDGNMPVGIRRW